MHSCSNIVNLQRLREWIVKPHEKLLKVHPELIQEMPFQRVALASRLVCTYRADL